MIADTPALSPRPGDPAHRPELPGGEPGDRRDELDLAQLWSGLRRSLRWILAAAVVGAGLTYLVSSQQPPVFEATTTLSTSALPVVTTARDAVVTAPPLPPGALEDVLSGATIMEALIGRVQRSPELPATRRAALSEALRAEYRQHALRTVTLDSQVDGAGIGLYFLTARGQSPSEAAVLADLSAQTLVAWDQGRAVATVTRDQGRVSAQLRDLQRQLANPELGSAQRQILQASQGSLQRALAQIQVQRQGTSGSLEFLSSAVTAMTPVSPRPTRNAAVVGVVLLLLAGGVTALRVVADTTIRREDDLRDLGWPVLGSVSGSGRSRRQRRAAGPDHAGSLGFLAVTLQRRLGPATGQVVMVTACADDEDTAALTTALASEMARAGSRVLLVDADVSGSDPIQATEHGAAPQDAEGRGRGVQTLAHALADPSHAEPPEITPGVHLLPAGRDLALSLPTRQQDAALDALLTRWSTAYDLILVRGSSLQRPASVVLGARVQHVLLVVRTGRWSAGAIRQSLVRAQGAGLAVTGLVLLDAGAPRGVRWARRATVQGR